MIVQKNKARRSHHVTDQRCCFCFNCNRCDTMHLSNALRILLGAASYASAVQFAPRQSADEPAAALGNTVPRRFIVELRSRGHAALAVDKIAGLAGLQVFKTFDSDIFPAVSVECDHDCNADSLRAALDGADGDAIVASVYQSTRMQLLTTVKGESFSDDAAASNYSVHGSTGVQALHDAGITGRGAIVAIVDSGVQYTHPAVEFLPFPSLLLRIDTDDMWHSLAVGLAPTTRSLEAMTSWEKVSHDLVLPCISASVPVSTTSLHSTMRRSTKPMRTSC